MLTTVYLCYQNLITKVFQVNRHESENNIRSYPLLSKNFNIFPDLYKPLFINKQKKNSSC